MPAAANSQSQAMIRCRKRAATGNSRKVIASTNATCTGRSVWVGTIA